MRIRYVNRYTREVLFKATSSNPTDRLGWNGAGEGLRPLRKVAGRSYPDLPLAEHIQAGGGWWAPSHTSMDGTNFLDSGVGFHLQG